MSERERFEAKRPHLNLGRSGSAYEDRFVQHLWEAFQHGFAERADLAAEEKAELVALRAAVIRAYNCGYKAGHHDTVEGVYVDLHDVDMDSYHEEQAQEVANEALANTREGREEDDV